MATQTQTLFQKINQLPSKQLAEVEKFVDKLSQRSPQQVKPPQSTPKSEESALLKIIREKSRIPFRRRLNELIRRRQMETITPDELAELTAMGEYLEATNVQRIKALIQLAELRGVTLEEVMEQLGINKSNRENP